MHPSALLGLLALASAALAIPANSKQAHSASSIKNLKSRIKNVVVLCMENRSIDNILGGQTIKGLENPINNGPYCNPYNVTDPSQGFHCTAPRDYNSVTSDPSHAVTGNTMEFYGEWTPDNTLIAEGKLVPNNNGFIHEQIHNYGSSVNQSVLATEVMNYYTEDQVPVLTALVNHFVTFNHWHSDLAGPTDPNRVALRSIFQQLGETNHTWLNYWDPAGGTGPESHWFEWTKTSGNTEKVVPITNFYADAAKGTLPEFSYLNPSCCGVGTNSMHDSGLISDGEAFIKRVYEALRASPQWGESLFILTFDETGGFHDHVPPPLATRPDNLTYTEKTANGEEYTYEFNRLGGRIPTLLISPWVSKGFIEQKGTDAEGRTVSYSASSILRTLGYLWDFEPFNPRVGDSASFEHLIRSKPRTNAPSTLPDPASFTL
ncbi:Phospholipase C PLC-B [Penicillium digitatum]|uniref:Phospholipase C PLC-B n=3 Tax=Penicillium digitatum TaxID=36651 RepID=K9G9E0_PEND2|nr:Phospholipase C PLC-B [Penicillium digitatum Pd1]EKV16323.1 Phospholipase C PLC-B [Penicillium digitatum Pd1]EKV18540.1 Phospholipase C PLC-B [Penicillium digitatum PHI26]QQK42535.1 Phospholipase C PLC-B [Penicillium digitatum]